MPKYIIGLTGSIGSGCTTVAKYLETKGYARISISKDVLEPLSKENKKPFISRYEKQDFGNYARETLRDVYKSKVLEVVNTKGNDMVIECFRNPIEIQLLRDEFPHFYLISLFATKDERKRRWRERGEKEEDFDVCDERDGAERGNSKEKFGQQVRKCVNKADIVLDNSNRWKHNDDKLEFLEKLDSYLRLLKEPYRPPTDNELLMHLAYSVSLHSLCIERQVGAVIVDENYRVLSTGYNDVPQASESCFDLYSQCYRKIKKKESLQKVCETISFCPYCGKDLNFREELFSCEPKTIQDNAFICTSCSKNLSEILSLGKELDYCRSLHAEENAILSNTYRDTKDQNMSIFTTTFPCMLCAKKIANFGIKKVVFVEPYPMRESFDIFQENGIEVGIFEGVKSLSFNWIFRDRDKYIKDIAYRRRI